MSSLYRQSLYRRLDQLKHEHAKDSDLMLFKFYEYFLKILDSYVEKHYDVPVEPSDTDVIKAFSDTVQINSVHINRLKLEHYEKMPYESKDAESALLSALAYLEKENELITNFLEEEQQ